MFSKKSQSHCSFQQGCVCEGTQVVIEGQNYCRGGDKGVVCGLLDMSYDAASDQCYPCPENSVLNQDKLTCTCANGSEGVLVDGEVKCPGDCGEGFELNKDGTGCIAKGGVSGQKKKNYLIYIIVAAVVVLMAIVGIAAFYKYRDRPRKTSLTLESGTRGEAMLLDNVNMTYNFDNK
ncbi:MAG: hypothetical protein MHMPM18_000859 [Marteilia pararefringens]